MKTPSHDARSALIITAVYLLFGVSWIYFSDRAVETLATGHALMVMQTYKGWIFVAVTAMLLYFLSYRLLHARRREYLAHLEEFDRRQEAETLLMADQAVFAQTGRLANIGRWGFDVATMEGSWNEETARIHDLEPSETVPVEGGLRVYEGENRQRIQQALHEAIESQKSYLLELEMTSYQGRKKWVRTLGIPIVKDGKTVRVEGMIQDITGQKEIEQRLFKNEALLRTIVDSVPDAIFVKDLDGIYLLFNEGAGAIVGKSPEEVLGKSDFDILPPQTARFVRELDKGVLEHDRVRSNEEQLLMNDGTERTFWVTKGPLRDAGGTLFGLFGVSRDITERKRNESKLVEAKEHFDTLAHFDTLTGLPNRLSLSERLTEKIADEIPLALMLLDLDGFRAINDAYGHRLGDNVLKQTAALLRSTAPEDAFFAHIGDDEFAVLIDHPDAEALPQMLERFQAAFERPVEVDNIELFMTASIGVASFPEDAPNAEGLFQSADTAMYEAKRMGKNTHCLYNARLTRDVVERTSMLSRIKKALNDDEFSLHYQPQVDPKTREITGVEALLRWFRPEGAISPAQFIPVAEESGVILQIGRFVLEAGCRSAARWAQAGCLPGRVAVNVSARQLNHADFLDELEAILERTSCRPEWIELEITESSILKNPDRITALLQRLKQRGFYISIDDFGTGYSSLSYLKNLPVDKLKIDQSFVRDIRMEPKNQTIIRTIASLAKGLGIQVLAEGVETEDELLFMTQNEVDTVQGFYYHKPMPQEAFETLFGCDFPPNP